MYFVSNKQLFKKSKMQQSNNNSNSNSNIIVTARQLNSIDEKNRLFESDERNGKKCLSVYIPRVDGRYSEQDIMHNLLHIGLGWAKYVDFVATKDPNTKQTLFFSAFVMMDRWNTETPVGQAAYANIQSNNATKIYLSNTEFWIILPAKTQVSRTKVNTHQLARYTDELFVKVGELETIKDDTYELQVNVAALNIRLDKQTEEIESLKIQMAAMLLLLAQPAKEPEPEPEPVAICTLTEQLLLDHNSLPPQQHQYYDDECFFLRPLRKSSKDNIADMLTKQVEVDDTFVVIQPQPRTTSPSLEETNSIRAHNSYNFCGNS
jgi:hypothetical protein